jgi:hypothetical protein
LIVYFTITINIGSEWIINGTSFVVICNDKGEINDRDLAIFV